MTEPCIDCGMDLKPEATVCDACGRPVQESDALVAAPAAVDPVGKKTGGLQGRISLVVFVGGAAVYTAIRHFWG